MVIEDELSLVGVDSRITGQELCLGPDSKTWERVVANDRLGEGEFGRRPTRLSKSPRNIVRTLVERGLISPEATDQYQVFSARKVGQYIETGKPPRFGVLLRGDKWNERRIVSVPGTIVLGLPPGEIILEDRQTGLLRVSSTLLERAKQIPVAKPLSPRRRLFVPLEWLRSLSIASRDVYPKVDVDDLPPAPVFRQRSKTEATALDRYMP